MVKYRYFLSIIFLVLFINACSTTKPNKIEKLNNTEYENLVNSSRIILLNMPDHRASQKDKEFIKENPPLFRVKYDGYKTGRYLLKWELPNGKTLQVFGNGDMLDFRDSFEKVSIVSIKVADPDSSQSTK